MTDSIEVASGVSHRTGEGFVTIAFGSESGQLTPQEAKLFALSIIEAADAAESDAAISKLLRGLGDFSPENVAMLLSELRELRGVQPNQGSHRASATFVEARHRESVL